MLHSPGPLPRGRYRRASYGTPVVLHLSPDPDRFVELAADIEDAPAPVFPPVVLLAQ